MFNNSVVSCITVIRLVVERTDDDLWVTGTVWKLKGKDKNK